MSKFRTDPVDRPVSSPESQETIDWLTIEEFARVLKIHVNTAKSWIAKGILVCGEDYIRIGKVIRVAYGTALIERLLKRSTESAKSQIEPTRRAASIGKPRINLA